MHSVAARLTCRALALLFVACAAHRYVEMPWQANHILSEVEARSKMAMATGDTAAAAVLARRNLEQLDRVAPATRDDANYYMLYAANERFINNLDGSARMYTA